jgi:calcium-dependent protein kinase
MWESPDPQARIKLIDFGLSKEYSPQNHILTERVGTLYSMSPETMKGIYTEKADLWSVAVCAFIMLTNGQCKPFEGRTPKEVVAKVLRGDYEFDDQVWKDISDEAKDFIAKLLVVQPSERPTAAMGLEHPWIVEGNQAMAESISTTEEFKTRVRDNIVRYADMGEFRKLALNVMAKKSSTSEIIELRKVFEEFDTLNTGAITLEEFTAALSQLNYREDEITEIFKKVDVNNSNVINYTEFLAATLEAQGAIEEYRIAEAFDAIDSDDSGYISRRNLRKILGGRSDEKYIDTLIAEADLRNDGRISYEEFLQVFADQKHENMRSLYEGSNPDNSPRKSSDEDLLRKHGIIKSIRKRSSGNLKRFASFGSSKS